MCGRFSLSVDARECIEYYPQVLGVVDFSARYNCAPGQKILCLLPEGGKWLTWGFMPSWCQDKSRSQINARSETLHEKLFFKEAYAKRRCLVLSNGFFEWKNKVPFYFQLRRRNLFAFAGIWEENQTVAIVTTEANEVVSNYHKRMPAILEKEEEKIWLAGSRLQLNPCTKDDLSVREVPPFVNSSKNEGPACVQRITLF